MVKLEKNKHRFGVWIDENTYTELHKICNTNVKTHISNYKYCIILFFPGGYRIIEKK